MKNFFKKIIKENKSRGFTILETLVAVFILVLAITGPMVFAQSGLRTAFLARDQITAFYLAQDAIESIKNLRDDNVLKGADWLDRIMICTQSINANQCLVKLETNFTNEITESTPGAIVVTECTSTTCPVLQNNAAGNFGYTFPLEEMQASRFTRNIHLTELQEGKELQIVVEVSWTSNVGTNSSGIVVQENIYNWIPSNQTEDEN